MKIITLNLPETYIELLKEIGEKKGVSRSELIRRAINEHLDRMQGFNSLIKEIYPNVETNIKKREEKKSALVFQKFLELKRKKISEFYNFCIVCESKLHPPKKPYTHKNMEIIELRFCCNCFHKYKKLDQLPESVVAKIQKKLRMYKNHKKSDTTL